MREFVGIKSSLDLIIEVASGKVPVENVLKSEALMFSRIGFPQVEQSLSMLEGLGHPLTITLANHLNYLLEQNVLFSLPPSAEGSQLELLDLDPDFRNLRTVEQPLAQHVVQSFRDTGLDQTLGNLGERLDCGSITLDEMASFLPQIDPSVFAPVVAAAQYYVRQISTQLRILDKIDAYPILSQIVPQVPLPQDTKCDVIDVVLQALPLPDDSVPWEQIVEYRSDPESHHKFLALRHWMSDVARAALTPAEVEEKLEYLISEYQRHMELHHMKTNNSTLETLFSASAEIIGGLLSTKWSKVAQVLFSLKRRRVALLESELTAPGREVAYIVKARERFSARK